MPCTHIIIKIIPALQFPAFYIFLYIFNKILLRRIKYVLGFGQRIFVRLSILKTDETPRSGFLNLKPLYRYSRKNVSEWKRSSALVYYIVISVNKNSLNHPNSPKISFFNAYKSYFRLSDEDFSYSYKIL